MGGSKYCEFLKGTKDYMRTMVFNITFLQKNTEMGNVGQWFLGLSWVVGIGYKGTVWGDLEIIGLFYTDLWWWDTNHCISYNLKELQKQLRKGFLLQLSEFLDPNHLPRVPPQGINSIACKFLAISRHWEVLTIECQLWQTVHATNES